MTNVHPQRRSRNDKINVAARRERKLREARARRERRQAKKAA